MFMMFSFSRGRFRVAPFLPLYWVKPAGWAKLIGPWQIFLLGSQWLDKEQSACPKRSSSLGIQTAHRCRRILTRLTGIKCAGEEYWRVESAGAAAKAGKLTHLQVPYIEETKSLHHQ
jgi:hypothetical protein